LDVKSSRKAALQGGFSFSKNKNKKPFSPQSLAKGAAPHGSSGLNGYQNFLISLSALKPS
jgi:hypothetical protein